jgi:hypothetical protein
MILTIHLSQHHNEQGSGRFAQSLGTIRSTYFFGNAGEDDSDTLPSSISISALNFSLNR